MRGARWGVGIVVALTCALLLAATASAEDTVFWANWGSDTLSHAWLEGGGAADFISGAPTVEEPYATVIDAATGKVYWINYTASKIEVANLDGSEPSTLDIQGITASDLSGLAIDPADGRIYWVELGTPGVFSAKLDGSDAEEIPAAGAVFDEPDGMALDPSRGEILWTNRGNSTIGWADIDGTGGGTLNISPPPEGPIGLAVDGATGKIYWANNKSSTIGFANLDGSGSGQLDVGAAPISQPEGVAVDPAGGTIYWANTSGSLAKASLSGFVGSELDVGTASVDEPNMPALLEKPVARPVPAVVTTVEVGSTLGCPTGDAFEPDLVESFLFRAPERETISWTLNGAALNGATSPNLIATQPGSYTCWVTGTNGAGSTVAGVKTISVAGTPSTTTPISVRLRPVSKLQILRLKYDKGHGTATLLAKVSGPGRLYLYGKNVIRRSVRSSGAGIAKLKVAAAGSALKTLRAAGNAKLRIQLKFVTSEGGVAKKARPVTLRLQK